MTDLDNAVTAWEQLFQQSGVSITASLHPLVLPRPYVIATTIHHTSQGLMGRLRTVVFSVYMAYGEEYDSDATYCSEIEGPRAVGVPVHSTPVHDTEFSALFDCETCPPDPDEYAEIEQRTLPSTSANMFPSDTETSTGSENAAFDASADMFPSDTEHSPVSENAVFDASSDMFASSTSV
ncbi:Hypp6124 [Branchiostoma lanceolatum]|uniref:Hypp6124 protein n=1 Tax=Branchiostoma lanceolatum TaxID=7740 RepID=A0A8J9YSR7_BRALA|nr:Hypp6124 [Branchiostoma lanceolatum]